jgi:membrane protein
MKGINAGLFGRMETLIWGKQALERPSWQQRVLRLVRMVLILARDLTMGQLTLRAMSLVYTTLLSIVPLLALSFSVLKAFGVNNQIQPMLLKLLEPLGEQGAEVAKHIADFIQNMNVGVLGAVGLALLLYTAISLVQKIEESLNYIWHIPQPRRLGERFSRYLSVLTVGPILVFSALGITATVMNIETVRQLLAVEALGQTVEMASRLVPYVLVIAAFTFVYLFIPNARVRLGSALVGGTIGGIVWQTSGWLFAVFVASSGQYAAIYSSFAILVLFMIWLYVSWLVLLFGASVAFYTQHPEYLYLGSGEPRLSNRVRERLALSVMNRVASRFVAGQPAPSLPEFTQLLRVPMHVLSTVVTALQDNQLLLQTADDPPLFLPARDPSLISVMQVLDAIRCTGEARFFSPDALPTPAPVDQILDQMRAAVEAAVGAVSLRDLADQPEALMPEARINVSESTAQTRTEPTLLSRSAPEHHPELPGG